MRGLSLNNFEPLRHALIAWRSRWLAWSEGILIGPDPQVSLAARFVSGGRGTITVGSSTCIALKTTIISRHPDGKADPVRIGSNCFIGCGSVIHPGVTIGDGTIVSAGSVVYRDVPGDCIVVGNPARVVRKGIGAGRYGMLPDFLENERACREIARLEDEALSAA